MEPGKHIAVVTCCLDDWGGSEELWSKGIHELINRGIEKVTVYKNKINHQHPEYQKLIARNVGTVELEPRHGLFKNMLLRTLDSIYRFGDRFGILQYQWNKPAHLLFKDLQSKKPNFVIISQGINFDGLVYAYQCLQLGIPYLIVCHKAVDFFWPQEGDRRYMKETLLKAKQCLFVSQHNLRVTEEQFGLRLSNAEVVFNPSKTPVKPLPYPDTKDGFKLACIGRLFVIDKGQDLLLRVLQQEKWKNRPLTVSFIGKGPDKDALVDLANLLHISKVRFDGFNTQLEDIWNAHHALILPSRSEGLPLTIIEAMSLGRTVIVTNAGGSAEFIDDNSDGFVAEVNEKALDAALEHAWQQRDTWAEMGLKAAEKMRELLPDSPEVAFADKVYGFLNDNLEIAKQK